MKNLLLIIVILTTCIFNLANANVTSSERPIALVWKNGGTCFPYCVSGAGKMAKKAGYQVRYITKRTKNLKEALKTASIWVQPGGESLVAVKKMGPQTMMHIREFVKNGGGYVGICAGMLLATKEIGTSGVTGLGILSGETVHLMSKKEDKRQILDVDMVEYGTRNIYFSGGPYLQNHSSNTYVTGYYSTGQVASVEETFGKGRVVVSGFHPEVPGWFKKLARTFDQDGSDYDIAIEMMKRAKRL